MVERLLVPRRIWKGGWYVSVWNSGIRCWEPAFAMFASLDLSDWPFLKHQEKRARAQVVLARLLFPRRRFRLQRIGAPWLLKFCEDLVWCSDAPERAWFEYWGGDSPLWRMLERKSQGVREGN